MRTLHRKIERPRRTLLVRRVVQLGLLLLLGLAAVAIGVHVALCRPLTLLSRAVAEWRSTGTFDPAYLGDPPREVHGLAASFAAAVATLAEQEARLKLSVEAARVADARDPSPGEEQPTDRPLRC